MTSTDTTSYHPFSKLLHWVTAAFWIAAWPIGFIAVHFRDEFNPDHGLTILHKAIASIIIFLTLLRIVWRLTHRPPPLPATMSPAMQRAAHFGHIGLYALALVALPLSGWLWSSVADKPIMMLGLFQLPPLTEPMPEYYDLAKFVHQWLSWVVGIVVVGHIALAFKHHFVDRDTALAGMLPKRGGR